MVDGMQLINQNVGIIALGVIARPEDVGIYRVALQGCALVSFGLTAVNMVVGPYISRLYEQERMDLLQRLVTSVTRLAFLMSLAIALFFVVAGPSFLAFLFGVQFSASYAPLIIMSVGQIVNAFTGCVGQILYMSEYEGDVARAVATGALCNIVLTAALTPLWGYNGAAVAMTASVFIWNAILAFRVWQRTRIRAVAFWKG
jgi:O-antigen/teichoic acid export membrane protein